MPKRRRASPQASLVSLPAAQKGGANVRRRRSGACVCACGRAGTLLLPSAANLPLFPLLRGSRVASWVGSGWEKPEAFLPLPLRASAPAMAATLDDFPLEQRSVAALTRELLKRTHSMFAANESQRPEMDEARCELHHLIATEEYFGRSR